MREPPLDDGSHPDRSTAALIRALDAMISVDVFVRSREKINDPAGVAWWEEEIRTLRAELDHMIGPQP